MVYNEIIERDKNRERNPKMAEISEYEAYVIARIEEMEQDPEDYNIEKIARIMMGGYCSIPPTEEEAEHVTELIGRNMLWGHRRLPRLCR